MYCENCAWAVRYSNEVVACYSDGKCPSKEDFERAEKEGCLAI